MSFLVGDGREMLAPPSEGSAAAGHKSARPIAVRRGTARRLVELFETRGMSSHSSAGSTIWVILRRCTEKGTAVSVTAHKAQSHITGFTVKRESR
jgi:hypothetical protein